MATPQYGALLRQHRRRQVVVDEILDHAIEIMAADGVAALNISEIARRMNMRGPSVYKYFASLHDMYDALFARGLASHAAAVSAAVAELPPGSGRLRAGAVATVRWAAENQALAQLLFWRPVPGFAPTAETFAVSQQQMSDLEAEFARAADCGDLTKDAVSGAAMRLWTVLLSGLISQHMANDPGANYRDGVFTSLTDQALDLFFNQYGRK